MSGYYTNQDRPVAVLDAEAREMLVTQYRSSVDLPRYSPSWQSIVPISPVDRFGMGFAYYKRLIRLTTAARALLTRGVPLEPSKKYWPRPTDSVDIETRMAYNMTYLQGYTISGRG